MCCRCRKSTAPESVTAATVAAPRTVTQGRLQRRLALSTRGFPNQPWNQVSRQACVEFLRQLPGTPVGHREVGGSGHGIELMQVIGQHSEFEQARGQLRE